MGLSMKDLFNHCRSQGSKMIEVTQTKEDFSFLNRDFDFKNAILDLFNGLEIEETAHLIIIDELNLLYNNKNNDSLSSEYYNRTPPKISLFKGFKSTSSFEIKYNIEQTLSAIEEIYSKINSFYQKESDAFLAFIYNNEKTRPFFTRILDISLKTQNKKYGISHTHILNSAIKNLDFNDHYHTSKIIDFCFKFNDKPFIIINQKKDLIYFLGLISQYPEFSSKFSNIINTDFYSENYIYNEKINQNLRSLINDITPSLIPDCFTQIISSKFSSLFFDYEEIFNKNEIKEYFKSLLNIEDIVYHLFDYCNENKYSKKDTSDFILSFQHKFKELPLINFKELAIKHYLYLDDIKEYFFNDNHDSVFHGVSYETNGDNLIEYLYGFIQSEIEKNNIKEIIFQQDNKLVNKKRI